MKSCGCGQGQQSRGTASVRWGRRSRRRLKPFQPLVQLPGPQLEPWPAEAKAEFPAHAQRMSSLFAPDKEFAFCRESGRRHAKRGARCGPDVGRAWGGGRASSVHRGWPDFKRRGPGHRSRHGEERTLNINCMSVTLDVSKLSGWLNADARCRVERRAYGTGRQAGGGGRPRCKQRV